VADLRRFGVRRVSLGSSLALAIMTTIQSAAQVVLEDGMFGPLGGALGFSQAQELFARRT
jgi:2-methylisocitrate lyase-like PEP mutase family enzyme